MANKIELIINTLIVVLTIVKTSAAGIVAPAALFSNTDENQFLTDDNAYQNGYLIRNKREAYIVPNDYYANYYNDYYNNYYDRPAAVSRPSADRFDDSDNYNNVVDSQGTRYVYTPIFKYKSTQQKRHKLFVPNLFG